MLKAESPNLSAVGQADFDVNAEWPRIRRNLDRAYVFGVDNPFADVTKDSLATLHAAHSQLVATWDQVRLGGALVVHWPPSQAPRVLAAA